MTVDYDNLPFDKQDEPPEEYDHLPRYEDMSDDQQIEKFSLGDDFTLAANLQAGMIPDVGTTIKKRLEGNTKAEALGKAYLTRDRIQDNGGSCEVRYIEPLYIMNNKVYHRIEIEITESN